MFNFFKSKPKEPARLCFSTDIHCHIVPGIDDGAKDPSSAADLVERMQRWGIERIIASPHVTQDTFENTAATLDPALDKLRDELRKRGNGIEVTHSAEYRIDGLLSQRLEDNDLMPYPNDYLLIENSFLQEPWNIDQLAFDLQVRGLRPILAHPERYLYYHHRLERYRQLHEAGLMLQINLLSLAGAYGSAEQKIARHLIKEGLVDFIGTDLHNTRHSDAIDAYLQTSAAHDDMDALDGVVQNDVAFL